MQTTHGYDDTEKLLTLEQWDNATTEQRSGFLSEGYAMYCPFGYEECYAPHGCSYPRRCHRGSGAA